MSNDLYVKFPFDRLPSPSAWQAAIRTNGFPLEIDCEFDPLTFGGFLPAQYEGQEAGFEYYFERGEGNLSQVAFRWGGSAHEAVSAIIAAACLCELTDGENNDPQSGETISPAQSVAAARRDETDLRDSIAEERKVKRSEKRSRSWWTFWRE